MDAAAGLAATRCCCRGAIGVFRQSSNQLMDRELPDVDRARIIELMTQDRRLIDVHQLRTRASGPIVHIQMHADLDPDLSLETAHEVVVAAEKRVLEAFPGRRHHHPRRPPRPRGAPWRRVCRGALSGAVNAVLTLAGALSGDWIAL